MYTSLVDPDYKFTNSDDFALMAIKLIDINYR